MEGEDAGRGRVRGMKISCWLSHRPWATSDKETVSKHISRIFKIYTATEHHCYAWRIAGYLVIQQAGCGKVLSTSWQLNIDREKIEWNYLLYQIWFCIWIFTLWTEGELRLLLLLFPRFVSCSFTATSCKHFQLVEMLKKGCHKPPPHCFDEAPWRLLHLPVWVCRGSGCSPGWEHFGGISL